MNHQMKPGTPEEIVHYGVKGMRWGVRNDNVPHGTPGAYKSVKAKRKDFTRQQRKTYNDLMRYGNQNRTYKQIRRGEKAAAGLLSQFGGLLLGTQWISPLDLTMDIPRMQEVIQTPEDLRKFAGE